MDEPVRAICFYLPQFHPIPENDAWWGQGFTEWRNVTKAQPLFRGHYQPQLPSELGFYDLRVEEARVAQAELAREHGIHGFCYYHYWFNGKRLLERPFYEVLSSGKPDFPFCLCWANESWSRRWLGEERDVLMAQTYSESDDENHAAWLCDAFSDPRYIKIEGRPMLLIYRPADLPDPKRTCETLRRVARSRGLMEPYLVAVDAHLKRTNYRKMGFDNRLNFNPHLGVLDGAFNDRFSYRRLVRNASKGILSGDLKVFEYDSAREQMTRHPPEEPFIPSVFVGWDNTARRGRKGIIIRDGSPEKFGSWLKSAISIAKRSPPKERFVFINAWNEWAEGNHLEPDLKNGRAYLNQVKLALDSN